MDENNPVNQGGVEEQKLQKLEKELGGLEKKASEVPPQSAQPSQPVQQPDPPQPVPPSPPMETMPQGTGRSKIVLWVGLSLLVLALVGVGAYYLGSRRTTPTTTPEPTPTQIPTPTPEVAADWSVYKDEKDGWSIKYPNGWIVGEEKESSREWWWPYKYLRIYDKEKDPQGGVSVFVYSNRGRDLRNWFEEITWATEQDLQDSYDYKPGFYRGVKIPDEPNSSVGGQPAFKLELGIPQDPSVNYFVKNEDVVLHILYPHPMAVEADEVYSLMISTVKFLFSSPTLAPTSTPSGTITP